MTSSPSVAEMASTEALMEATNAEHTPEKQIGLFVTKELSHAIEACRDEVERVVAECKAQNVKFRCVHRC